MRLPKNGPPVTPGEILLKEFLVPLGMSQSELANRLGIPFQRVNQIVKGKRAVTPDTALRLARLFGTTPDLWLNLQMAVDLYAALHSPEAASIKKIKPAIAA
jgi:addiction module HigA family antidote